MGTRPNAWGQGMRPPHRDKRHNFQPKPKLMQSNAHRHVPSRFDTKLQIDKTSHLDKSAYADALPTHHCTSTRKLTANPQDKGMSDKIYGA